MRDEDMGEIRALPLFHEMEESNFSALLRAAYVQTFPPLVELGREGDRNDFLHVVVEGAAELYAGWDGRETSMGALGPLSTFILAATIRDAPWLMSARTLERSRIILLPSGDVRAVFGRDGAFARAVVAELAHGFRGMVKHAKDLKLRNGAERLANHILVASKAAGSTRFELGTEKRRLASWLGMTPENLSRALKALRPHGAVVEGSRVYVTDPAALEAFAKPTPLIDDPVS